MSADYLYRVIDNDLFAKLGIKLERTFYTLEKGEYRQLEEKPLPGSSNPFERALEDGRSRWDHTSSPAYVDFDLTIATPKALYGPVGVVYDGTEVGVGLEWRAKASKVRGFILMGTISQSDSVVRMVENKVIVKDWTSDVVFRIVFYIKTPGRFGSSSFRGNDRGLILGRRDLFMVAVSGKGSTFPVVLVNKEKGPLWSVTATFSDPMGDPFQDEYVRIELNTANPAYSFIDEENAKFNPEFLKETLCAAVYALILEIRSQYDGPVDTSVDGEYGSIHTAMSYFESSGIDINGAPAALANDVLSFIEKGYK